MSNPTLSEPARAWMLYVCARLGLSERDCEQCLADHVLVLGEVVVLFSQAATGTDNDLIVRALIGEAAPQGECEPLYELVLRTQLLLCGPFTPVLGLDTTSRNLLVSHCVDLLRVKAEDGAQVLHALCEMALHWREAIARVGAGIGAELESRV